MDCYPPNFSVMGFSRQGYWSRLPYPPAGDLPNPGIEPVSFRSPALAGGFFTSITPWDFNRKEKYHVEKDIFPFPCLTCFAQVRENWPLIFF